MSQMDIHDYARYGEFDQLKELVENGADINVLDDNGATALHKCAVNGHLSCVQYLIEKGAEYVQNSSGSTPLHWAALAGQREVAQYLLEHIENIDVLMKDEAGKSALTMALDRSDTEFFELLLQHPSSQSLVPEDAK